MIRLITLLIEGGWASKLTQNTKLTPDIVRQCVVLYEKFVKDFNEHLKSKNMQEVQAGKPVGSSAYYKVDDPDKEYGDVDILFYIPKLENTTDNKNKSIYADEIVQFLKGNSDIQTENGRNLIFKLEDDNYAQIDLVNAYIEDKDWAVGRMTPERGVKGAIGGYLYSALAELLNFSINTQGVQVKTKGGMPVKFTSGKVDSLDTVTRDIQNFGIDISKYYYNLIVGKNSKDMVISKSLRSTPGINPDAVKNEDIARVVKGIGETLEANDLFGKGPLSGLSSYDDFVKKIANIYTSKMEKAINDTKFDKAEGPEGERKAKEAKDKLSMGLKQVLKFLK